jgi:ribosomal subunit interface protein
MKVLLKGVHLQLTPALKGYVEEHLVERIENFYDDEAAELDVILADNNGPKGGEDKECRVTLFIPGSNPIHVTEASANMYESIDFARDRLEKALKRELEKKREVVGHPTHNPAGRLAPRAAFIEGETLPDV